MTDVPGGCLCGALRYRVTLPSLWCAFCHCGMCRKAHGASPVAWFGVPRDRFAWIASPDEHLGRYASSPGATRSFCRRCGSPLLFESERWADQVHVALATLDGTLDRPPSAHVFFDDRAGWATPTDDLPRLGGPDGTTPIAPPDGSGRSR
ncbi:MAG: GFA family protein [Deltaproteobacteria bacterium]|nr:GFA family protein [Deltaproteobacteria bacterium]